MIQYIIWDIDPMIFSWAPFVRWYGLSWAFGISLGYYAMGGIYRREQKPSTALDALALYLVVGGIIGARFGHVLFYDPIYYLQHPLEILPIKWTESGLTFTGLAGLASHGGGIGAFIGLFLYCRKYSESALWILDRLTVPVAMIGGSIRLGNLLNSEIIGIPTNVPWAFVFTRVDQIPRHPAQLYEAIFYFVLGIGMLFLYRTRQKSWPAGRLFGLFLMALFAFRFFIEFYKEIQVSFESEMFINMGQILSIPYLLVGLILCFRKTTQQHSGV